MPAALDDSLLFDIDMLMKRLKIILNSTIKIEETTNMTPMQPIANSSNVSD
jgi:hypothetical protein